VALLILKYFGELGLYELATHHFLTPLNFLSPVFTSRYPLFALAPDWFGPLVVLWSVPFIWIGTGMSIRRAADSGLSPWLGLLFFVPGCNYLLMLGLSLRPSSQTKNWQLAAERIVDAKIVSPMLISFFFAVIGTLLAWWSTDFFRVYAMSLFVGSPLILGLVQSYFLNRRDPQSFSRAIGFVSLTILLIHLFLLVFALEGLICLAMSLPISLVLGAVGAVFGEAISRAAKPSRVSPLFLVFFLPLMPWMEKSTLQPLRDVVLSTVIVDAPPEKVWPNVVKFSDLPPATEWLFKLGVAHPIRARIDGQGVGAIRHCEFSTGSFVEPITTWDEPRHLAFNVSYQPQPMKEISFYDHVDAPHLNGYFRSVKGEFRLVPLAGGKTRIEGRTWYEVDMEPGWYWQVYGRWFIHRVHLRVLDHIKALSEA
jgi:hypothetical protein